MSKRAGVKCTIECHQFVEGTPLRFCEFVGLGYGADGDMMEDLPVENRGTQHANEEEKYTKLLRKQGRGCSSSTLTPSPFLHQLPHSFTSYPHSFIRYPFLLSPSHYHPLSFTITNQTRTVRTITTLRYTGCTVLLNGLPRRIGSLYT